jgi:hypothetical protein
LRGFKFALAVVALGLALMAGPFVWHVVTSPEAPVPTQGLPWQISPTEQGGTRVMGLEPGRSPLALARTLWPQGVSLAVMARGQEPARLEVFAETVTAGYVTGKAVLTAAWEGESVDSLRARAASEEVTASGARRYKLAPQDETQAWTAPVRLITFVPTARLAPEVVNERFGPPTERKPGAEQVEHLLYPERGLAVTLDTKGRAVLQYVHPTDFAWLRQHLLTVEPASR